MGAAGIVSELLAEAAGLLAAVWIMRRFFGVRVRSSSAAAIIAGAASVSVLDAVGVRLPLLGAGVGILTAAALFCLVEVAFLRPRAAADGALDPGALPPG